MKKFVLLLITSFAASFLFGQHQVGLSDADISFTFVSKKVNGTIAGFSSSSKIDKNNLKNSIFKGSVKTKTLDSGNFLRNWSLKGSKYFDTDTYPTITFESTSVSENNTGYDVSGQLTIKDITKPITITFKKEGDSLVGTTTLFSSDFGIEVLKKGRESNKVIVKMSFNIK